jgi:hypothetical protein
MIPLLPNPALVLSPVDLGIQVGEEGLEAPVDVLQILSSLGVRTAEVLVPTLREWPTAFARQGLTPQDVLLAADHLESRLIATGLTSLVMPALPVIGFGALPPTRKG